MRSFLTGLLVASLSPFTAALTATAQDGRLAGSYVYVAAESDDVEAAINRTVAGMSFLTRPIARARLRATNQPYPRLDIALGADSATVTTDRRAPLRAPTDGTPVAWRREDGEVFEVAMRWDGRRLRQRFTASDGERENAYHLNDDGQTLHVDVTVNSRRLPRPLTYRHVYRRVGREGDGGG